ncbi:hypothetical protein C5167_002744 [Papaver somniferum]|uniref:Uncharacterized protein n=1 Tax=Papaver somniferum TaxID=3469 RepID=A0A4Y7KYQ4_PAPSO|nr:hypothetical protein C5167_002744 [Papaver somniferum]
MHICKAIRQRSIPIEPSKCGTVEIGDLVVCFQDITGTNTAYVGRPHAIPKWNGLLPKSGEMAVVGGGGGGGAVVVGGGGGGGAVVVGGGGGDGGGRNELCCIKLSIYGGYGAAEAISGLNRVFVRICCVQMISLDVSVMRVIVFVSDDHFSSANLA